MSGRRRCTRLSTRERGDRRRPRPQGGRGDSDALAAIYDRYGDRVFGLCMSMLRNREAAADATQDTFVAAWQRIGQLRQPERLRPWLFAIARNRVIGHTRSRAASCTTRGSRRGDR